MMEQWIIKFRNNWDFIIYGIKIRKINPYFLIINLFTLVYSFFQYESFFSEKNIVLLLFLIFINIIWKFEINAIFTIYNLLIINSFIFLHLQLRNNTETKSSIKANSDLFYFH